jgi:branched-chain amino acid transport system substrate-binding protein
MKRFVTVLLIAPLVFCIAVGISSRNAQADEVLKIGAILNFTGAVAFIGPLHQNAIVKALEEVNYMVAGKKIELIAEDAANDMNVCLEKAKKLVERDKVNIIIGPIMGDAQFAIAPYLADKKVLACALYAGSIDLNLKYSNWINYPTTLVGLTLPVGYFAGDQGYKTMITIGADYAGGRGFIEGIKLGFEEKGGKVIQQIWTPVGTTDFAPYLTTLKKADCIGYFFAAPTTQQRFLSQAKEFDLKIPLLATIMSGQLIGPFLTEFGELALGLRGQAIYLPDRDDPINKKWVKEMTERFGKVPGGFESNAYAVTRAVLAGLEATGGDDSFDKLRPAILKVKIDTPQGPLAFGPEGVAITNNYIAEVKEKNGKYYLDPIKTYQGVIDPRLKK